MSRMIDVNDLLKPMEDSYRHAGVHDETYRKVKKWIRKAPQITVVRCEDCLCFHAFAEHDDEIGDGFCDAWEKFVPFWGFCHKGEEGINATD